MKKRDVVGWLPIWRHWVFVVTVWCHLVFMSTANREHKVHNIVLYPDKQSWCKTTPVKQVVTERGYEHRVVENNVCVGTCFSYSVPHTSDITLQPYCDSCQPSDTDWFHITLKKVANAEEELDVSEPLPDTYQKKIQIINNCTCMNCIEQILQQQKYNGLNAVKCLTNFNTTEIPERYYVQSKNVEVRKTTESYYKTVEMPPEGNEEEPATISSASVLQTLHSSASTGSVHLINLVNITADQQNNAELANEWDKENNATTPKYALTKRILATLRSIQTWEGAAEGPQLEEEALHELLDVVAGRERRLTDRNLMEFVNFFNVYNSEDFELDFDKLQQVLVHYTKELDLKHELQTRHKQFGLGTEPALQAATQPPVKASSVVDLLLNTQCNDTDIQTTTLSTNDNDAIVYKDTLKDPSPIRANPNLIDDSDKKKESNHHYSGGDAILLRLANDVDNVTSHDAYHQTNVVEGYLVHGPHGSLVASAHQPPPEN